MDARIDDFADVRNAMQRYVDQDILAGVSWAVLRGRDVVDQHCVGWADKEANVALRPDHIFRMFSSTTLNMRAPAGAPRAFGNSAAASEPVASSSAVTKPKLS